MSRSRSVAKILKQVVSPGTYWVRGVPVPFSAEDCQHFARQGNEMLRAGLPIRVPAEHQSWADPYEFSDDDERRAKEIDYNRGFVTAFLFDEADKSTWAELDIPDAKLAARLNTEVKYVSPRILPEFTDGAGRTWHNAIAHVALTAKPVDHHQKPFGEQPAQPVALSLSHAVEAIGKEPLEFSLSDRIELKDGVWAAAPIDLAVTWKSYIDQKTGRKGWKSEGGKGKGRIVYSANPPGGGKGAEGEAKAPPAAPAKEAPKEAKEAPKEAPKESPPAKSTKSAKPAEAKKEPEKKAPKYKIPEAPKVAKGPPVKITEGAKEEHTTEPPEKAFGKLAVVAYASAAKKIDANTDTTLRPAQFKNVKATYKAWKKKHGQAAAFSTAILKAWEADQEHVSRGRKRTPSGASYAARELAYRYMLQWANDDDVAAEAENKATQDERVKSQREGSTPEQRMSKIVANEKRTGIPFKQRLVSQIISNTPIAEGTVHREGERATVLRQIEQGDIDADTMERALEGLAKEGFGRLNADEVVDFITGRHKAYTAAKEQSEKKEMALDMSWRQVPSRSKTLKVVNEKGQTLYGERAKAALAAQNQAKQAPPARSPRRPPPGIDEVNPNGTRSAAPVEDAEEIETMDPEPASEQPDAVGTPDAQNVPPDHPQAKAMRVYWAKEFSKFMSDAGGSLDEGRDALNKIRSEFAKYNGGNASFGAMAEALTKQNLLSYHAYMFSKAYEKGDAKGAREHQDAFRNLSGGNATFGDIAKVLAYEPKQPAEMSFQLPFRPQQIGLRAVAFGSQRVNTALLHPDRRAPLAEKIEFHKHLAEHHARQSKRHGDAKRPELASGHAAAFCHHQSMQRYCAAPADFSLAAESVHPSVISWRSDGRIDFSLDVAAEREPITAIVEMAMPVRKNVSQPPPVRRPAAPAAKPAAKPPAMRPVVFGKQAISTHLVNPNRNATHEQHAAFHKQMIGHHRKQMELAKKAGNHQLAIEHDLARMHHGAAHWLHSSPKQAAAMSRAKNRDTQAAYNEKVGDLHPSVKVKFRPAAAVKPAAPPVQRPQRKAAPAIYGFKPEFSLIQA